MEPHGNEVPEYDPALVETLREGAGNDEVSVIARLSGDHPLPEGVRVVTRFGDIATLRVRRDRIPELAASEAVTDLEASHALSADMEDATHADEDVAFERDGEAGDAAAGQLAEVDAGGGLEERAEVPVALADSGAGYTRRPAGVRATGRGVVVAVLDWGCDFAHPAFRRADGSTRLLAIWDQRHRAGAPRNRWGYGRIITRAEIDRALATRTPYATLGYNPGDADSRNPTTGEWDGCHGTHVLDIAAGNGRGGGLSGVAPEADLLFVHLAGTADVLGRGNLGDSVTVLEALDFVFETAGDRPCVVNMSVGAQGGPKDGTTLVELGVDRAIWLKRGRATLHSCGNYYLSQSHAQGRLRRGEEKVLRFSVPRSDPTPSELEVWYSGADRFTARVFDQAGHELGSAAPGRDTALVHNRVVLGHIYHVRHTGNGDHHINIFLNPMVPSGTWQLRLRGETVIDGRYHAYIERERNRPEFTRQDASNTSTTGTICNGRLSIAVGAYDPHRANRPMGGFSSSGPTRDGRTKPELIAPGVRIRAARSCPPGAAPDARYVSKDGTSMAAPHVTGAVALLFEVAGEPLEIYDTRALLLTSLERAQIPVNRADEVHRVGMGYLDIAAAERAARRWAADRDADEQTFEPLSDTPTPEVPMQEHDSNGAAGETGWHPPADEPAGADFALSESAEPPESLPDPEIRDIAGAGADFTESGDADAEGEDADWDDEAEWEAEDEGIADDDAAEDAGWIPDAFDDVAASDTAMETGIGSEAASLVERARELADSVSGSDPDTLRQTVYAALGLPAGATASPIAVAGMPLPTPVRAGDVLVRADASVGVRHTAVILGRPMPAEELEVRGVRLETGGPGSYVAVLETQPGGTARVMGRRLTDAWGRLPRGQEIHRVADTATDAADATAWAAEWQQAGQVAGAGGQVVLDAADHPAHSARTLDGALEFALQRDQNSWLIRGDGLRGARFDCLLVRDPVRTGGSDTIDADIPGCDAALFDGHLYVPADLIARGTRWVRLPRPRAFYALADADRRAQRRRWIGALAGANPAIAVPGVTVDQRWLNGRSMPTLRVLLAMFAARALRVGAVEEPARQRRGGWVQGRTLPVLRYPLAEPECYLPVIAEVEGRLEAINAWDLGAGLSIGPIQINVQRSALFRFLDGFHQRDPVLFRQTLGQGAQAFAMQAHGDHTDLIIGAGGAAVTLHGRRADQARNIAWFQSGVADAARGGFAHIDAAHRRALAARFRDAIAWPHVQDVINETSAWWLGSGLAMIHQPANGIPALDVRAPDRDTFILKALLLSAFVRYSACLPPLLQALRRWPSPADKLAHIGDALDADDVGWGACNAHRRARLRVRLNAQRAHAAQVYAVIERLRQRVGVAGAPLPGGAHAPAPVPAPAAESGPPASVFLNARSGGYTDYVRAATTGRVTLLLNGRSSGGGGPDVDLTEPLSEMERVVRALGERDRVLLGAWFFEPETPLTLGPYRSLTNWGGLLAAKAIEGVRVRIIINDFDPISGQDVAVRNRTLIPLRRLVAAMPAARRDNLKFILSLHEAHFGRARAALAGQRGPIYIASHHQKFMIARRGQTLTAFCGGLDIEGRKHPVSWDYRGLIGWHDVHMKLNGPIAYDVEQEFVMRWNRERGRSRQPLLPGWRALEELHPTTPSAADQQPENRTQQVQLTRTVSSNATLAAFSNDRADIREAYRRIIGRARRFLYFENQYLRSPDLGDEIVRQGRAHQDLQVMFVVVESAADDDGDNILTRHGNYLQYEMLHRVVRALGTGRVRIYTMYHRAVHAKVVLADDRWASIGSANANERSFQLDTELNLTFDDEAFVRSVRHRMWSFTLGEPIAAVRGWSPNAYFAQWDRVAAMNRGLRSRPQDMQGAGIIPFDYTRVRGSRSRVIPDYLVKLDFGTDPLGVPAPGTAPPGTVPQTRPGVAYA